MPKPSGKASQKTAGEVSFQGRNGAMYLHPMAVNFNKKELDSRYGVYHEVVKTSKVMAINLSIVNGSGCLFIVKNPVLRRGCDLLLLDTRYAQPYVWHFLLVGYAV